MCKGLGAYKTTIGFLDGVAHYSWSSQRRWFGRKSDGTEFDETSRLPLWAGVIVVEVKIQPVDAATILRQLRLYQEFVYEPTAAVRQSPDPGIWCARSIADYAHASRWCFWVVAAAFDLPAQSVAMLREHHVRVVRLGKKFEAWCETQPIASSTMAPPEEV